MMEYVGYRPTDDEMWRTFYYLRASTNDDEIREWELGKEIVHRLIEQHHITLYGSTEINTLMGIPVRINYENPMCINLWRKVE